MEIERIFAKIAAVISPSKAELQAEKKFAAEIIKKLESKLPKTCNVSFVGSAARDTGLRGDRDIDLFAAFPREMDEEVIVKKTFAAAKNSVKAKWITHYAEHPYLQTTVDGFKVEVIPCFQVEPHSGIKSAVDRSPLHMQYLEKKLTQRQRRDVRVLKKLLKVHQIYGAEVEVGGFSGLVCEQLMLKYGGLENLLREAAKWLPPIYIDYEGTWNAENKSGKMELMHKFPDAKFILIDVIDRNRNAAAAVSPQSLAKFILLSRAFVKKPSESFFIEKKKVHNAAKVQQLLHARGTTFVMVEMKKPDVIEDILFPQLKRSEKNISRELQKSGFRVFGSCDNYAKGQLLFEIENACLVSVKKLVGPPAWLEKNVSQFLKNKKIIRGPYLEEEKICLDIRQSETSVEKILKAILASGSTGISSHWQKPAKNGKARMVKKIDASNVQILAKYLLETVEWV
ncbi:MAG: CCA tRNA nucleotidyltransferase [Candidatus Micrarchaeota archaeon]|nr:CCA tRNA nucleotidyltransferase [Candidatus Micrarchaeota archaeon]